MLSFIFECQNVKFPFSILVSFVFFRSQDKNLSTRKILSFAIEQKYALSYKRDGVVLNTVHRMRAKLQLNSCNCKNS